MGDRLGVLITGDLKRVDQSTFVPLRLGEVQIVLHSHEDVAKLIRDLVGLDAEDVVRGFVKPNDANSEDSAGAVASTVSPVGRERLQFRRRCALAREVF
jgi:hypothetical protein